MGMASHLGPWLLGTVKNTTDSSTAGKVRNMGAAVVAQTKAVSYTDPSGTLAFAIPAGSLITNMQFITTTTFTAATNIVVSVAGVAVNGGTVITTGGSYAISVAPTPGGSATLLVGSTDALITYQVNPGASTAGAGILVMQYIVRNSDGSITPTSYTA